MWTKSRALNAHVIYTPFDRPSCVARSHCSLPVHARFFAYPNLDYCAVKHHKKVYLLLVITITWRLWLDPAGFVVASFCVITASSGCQRRFIVFTGSCTMTRTVSSGWRSAVKIFQVRDNNNNIIYFMYYNYSYYGEEAILLHCSVWLSQYPDHVHLLV